MTGGDQSRLVKLLDRQGLSEQIRDAWSRGVLVGGSSAGAAACAPTMIAGGMSDGVLRRNSLLLDKGLCLLPSVIVDTHFAQRKRYNRLRAAVATLAGTIGVGLDEDTALVIEGHQARVVGAGSVYVCSRGQANQAINWETTAAACLVKSFAAKQSFSISSELSFSQVT
jgi:cyanophycinase